MSLALTLDLLTPLAAGLRAVTLPAGLLVGGSAGAATLLRGLGCPPDRVTAAACRLARPLLLVLIAAALPLAVLETLWQTGAPLDGTLLADLLPYMLAQTLFGIVWGAHLLVLAVLWARLSRGRAPGLAGSAALLAAWPQIGHLAPNFAVTSPDTLIELGWLGIHRAGAALWPGTLAVLLLWSRPGGPAAGRPWGAAFARFALPGAALLGAGAAGVVANHGGWAAILAPVSFATLVRLKIALLAALVALGAWHFRRYRAPAAPPRRTLGAEVAVALAAVLLGALLGVLPSPGN